MSSEPLLSHRLAIRDEDSSSDNGDGNCETHLPSSQPFRKSIFKFSNLLWLFGPWIVGVSLGLLLCTYSSLPPPLDKISGVVGWVYFSAWSISFYPQIWTNYRRKSVEGLSIDFQLLNILGFSCYAIYNCALFFIPAIREQYAEIHSGQLPAVHMNDVAFSVHAFLLTGVTLTQSFLYRHNTTHDSNNNDDSGAERPRPRRAHHRPATASILAVTITVIISLIWAGIILVNPTVDPPPNPCTKASCPPQSLINWLSFIYFLSGIKFFGTLVKYIPQVLLNCSRQSTKGWNVWNVLLDFEGGILSLAQQIIDAVVCSSWIPLIGSPIKFGLSLISMVFDVIFIVQHFVLYPDWKRKVAGQVMAADYERLLDA